jgi:hypothetical protein
VRLRLPCLQVRDKSKLHKCGKIAGAFIAVPFRRSGIERRQRFRCYFFRKRLALATAARATAKPVKLAMLCRRWIQSATRTAPPLRPSRSPSAGIRPENSRFESSARSGAKSSPTMPTSARSSLPVLTIPFGAFEPSYGHHQAGYKSVCTNPIALPGFASAAGLRSRAAPESRPGGRV